MDFFSPRHVLVILVSSFISITHAADRCSVPPYGATPKEVHAFTMPAAHGYAMLQQHKGETPLSVNAIVAKALRDACRAKFFGLGMDIPISAGLSVQQIKQSPVAILAVTYIGHEIQYELDREAAKLPAKPLMTVENFLANAPSLAAHNRSVVVTGVYRQGPLGGELYPSQLAIEEASQIQAPVIVVDSSEAPPKVRAAFIRCQENPVSSEIGCPMTLVGMAETCVLENTTGATIPGVCIAPSDVRPPPGPSEAQIAAEQAASAVANQEAQARQLQQQNALADEVRTWEQNISICIETSLRVQNRDRSASPLSALNRFLGHINNQEREQSSMAQSIYTSCARSFPWPRGAPVPTQLPDPIEEVIRRCITPFKNFPPSAIWYRCTGNDPPWQGQ